MVALRYGKIQGNIIAGGVALATTYTGASVSMRGDFY